MSTALSTSPAAAEEQRAFLQMRVASFGLVATIIGLIGFVLRPILVALAGQAHLILHPSAAFHVLAFGPMTIAWLVLRRNAYSRRALLAIEQAALLFSCLGFVGLCVHIPIEASPELLTPFGFGLVLIVRAVFVPSPARRTLLTAVAAGPLIIGATIIAYANVDPPNLGIDFGTGMSDAYIKASMTMVWWIFITMVTTVTSNVIYGLRREIRDIRKLGQYTLERKLGEGGMGAVYRASHSMLRRPAAIKLLPPRKLGEASVARFEREVQLTAKLTHPNTITVYDYGRTPDGVFYYAMELIEGLTLAELVRISGPLPASRVVHLLSQAAGSLAEAHEVGLIHRDIKPANIMVCRQGGVADTVKVVDFGLVKELDNDLDSSLSNAETIQGTPLYMSPEAIRAPREVGPTTDIYSLGAVAYYLLTGTHIFAGNAVEVCGHHLHTVPAPLSERVDAEIAPALEALVLACLAKQQQDRPASAEALLEALDALDVPRWTHADARRWWSENSDEIRSSHDGEALSSSVTLQVELAVLAHAR